MNTDQSIKKFKRVTTALVSAVVTVCFCAIFGGVRVEALEQTYSGNMAITAKLTPEGLKSANTEITFKIDVTGAGVAPYDYDVDYGDETSDSTTSSEKTHSFKHSYSSAGDFEVTILVMDAESKWGVINIMYEVSAQTPAQCSDKLDNDGDGLTDYPKDPGCQNSSDNDESNATLPQCSNFIDDDGDGFTDYVTGVYSMLSDPECSDKQDNNESPDIISGANTGTDTGTGTGTGANTGTGTNGTNTGSGSVTDTGTGTSQGSLFQTDVQGIGTLGYTPQSLNQSLATLSLQNSTTGNTAGTGPGIIFYFLFPAIAFAYQQVKKPKKHS